MAYSEEKLDSLHDVALIGGPGTVTEDNLSKIGAGIVAKVLAGYSGSIAIRLWDGTLTQGAFDAPCTVIFREPGALRDLILHRNLLRLAESYLSGAIEVEGDLESLFDLKTHLLSLNLPLGTRLHLLYQALRLPMLSRHGSGQNGRSKRASHKNSQASIAHHYDVSNDFYKLWLDPEMVYSCAYYRSNTQPLAEAQQDKLDYLCRKFTAQIGRAHV